MTPWQAGPGPPLGGEPPAAPGWQTLIEAGAPAVPAPRRGDDLEYDLAHEWAGQHLDPGAARPAGSVYVATETPDQGSDYSYDLAHDVPGR